MVKLLKFKYTKQLEENTEVTEREVLVLHSTKDYYTTLDFGHLTERERVEAVHIQEEYEKKMEPFIKKALRNFSKDKMEIHK